MTSRGKRRGHGIPQGNTAAAPKRGRDQARVIVTVVCEGKTERGYLERVNSELGQESRFVIQLEPGSQPAGGYKPTPAVDRAIDARKRHYRTDKDRVWVAFDRDQNHDVDSAIRKALANNIKVAYSTPSFDLWLWLHFAPGRPSLISDDNEHVVKKLNGVPKFEHYGKRSGGKSSDSKPKILNDAQLAELWAKREIAVRWARDLVDNCTSGRCKACEDAGEPGHVATCDPMKRDTQTDFYRLLEVVGVVDAPAKRSRKRS
jgi:hypothetical protein